MVSEEDYNHCVFKKQSVQLLWKQATLRGCSLMISLSLFFFFLKHSGRFRPAPVRALVSWTDGWGQNNRWKTAAWFLQREGWKRCNLSGAREWQVHQKLQYLPLVLCIIFHYSYAFLISFYLTLCGPTKAFVSVI